MAKTLKESLNNKLATNPKFKKEWEKGKKNREMIDKIINIRLKLELTQKEVALLMGTSQAYISKIENGNVKIGLNFLEKFTDQLGLSLTTNISIPKEKKNIT